MQITFDHADTATVPESLYEQARPRTWDDVVGQDDALRRIDFVRNRSGLRGQVFWVSGNSGQGKTSIARLIAEEISDEWARVEIDAQDVTLELLRSWESDCRLKPIGKGCWCFVLNEAHTLSGRVVSRLQTLLENPHVRKNSTWVFTTTKAGQQHLFDTRMDAAPFLSRAKRIELETRPDALARPFAERARAIAQAEGLDGRPLSDYVALVKREKCNLRSVFQVIESGEMAFPPSEPPETTPEAPPAPTPIVSAPEPPSAPKHRITLYRKPDGWQAVFSDPEIRAQFKGGIVPTTISPYACAEVAVAEMSRLNPDADVRLG